jgi:hypothetical protein
LPTLSPFVTVGTSALIPSQKFVGQLFQSETFRKDNARSTKSKTCCNDEDTIRIRQAAESSAIIKVLDECSDYMLYTTGLTSSNRLDYVII